MKKFQQDPWQAEFNKKLEEGGTEFKQEGKNRLLTTEEWFAKYYQGQNDQELPAKIIEQTSPEELLAMKEKYGPKKQAVAEQTTLDL
jgi:hypothetical protein